MGRWRGGGRGVGEVGWGVTFGLLSEEGLQVLPWWQAWKEPWLSTLMGPPPRSCTCRVVSLSFLQPGRGGAKDEAGEFGLRGYTCPCCFLPVRPTVSTPGADAPAMGCCQTRDGRRCRGPAASGAQPTAAAVTPAGFPGPALCGSAPALTRSHLRGF